MARRSDHTKEELKALIFNAAKEIVVKEGYRELSARKIADKIGYTAGTLYNFFKDINDLVMHVNAETLDHLYEYLNENVQSVKHKEQIIFIIGKAYVDFCHNNPHLWKMLFEYHFPRLKGAKLPAWYEQKIAKPFTLLEEALLPFLKKHRAQSSLYTKILWASIHGICTLSITGKLETTKSESAQVLTESLIKTFIKGQT